MDTPILQPRRLQFKEVKTVQFRGLDCKARCDVTKAGLEPKVSPALVPTCLARTVNVIL